MGLSETYKWSDWYDFNDKKKLNLVPNCPGIYEVKTDYEFGRLNGSSSIITIGRSRKLLERRRDQKSGNPIKFFNRAEKWLYHLNHSLKFRYCICNSDTEAKLLEAIKLWEYESYHWELPPGNDKLEQKPIVEQINNIYQSIDLFLNGLEQKKYSLKEAADTIGVSQDIVSNCIVYWGNTQNNKK